MFGYRLTYGGGVRGRGAARGGREQGRVATRTPTIPVVNNCVGKMSGCCARTKICGVRYPNATRNWLTPKRRLLIWRSNWCCAGRTRPTLPNRLPLTAWPATRGAVAESARVGADRVPSRATRDIIGDWFRQLRWAALGYGY